MRTYFKLTTLLAFGTFTLLGCSKLLEIDTPKNQLTPDKVFSDTVSVKSALYSIYAKLERDAHNNYSSSIALYTDELNYSTTSTNEFLISDIPINNPVNQNIWSHFYSIIYQCNDILEQLEATALSSSFKNIISAESKFLRAYSYLYLLTLYDHIPLLLETNVSVTSKAKQIEKNSVYLQIVKDLKEAKAVLSGKLNTEKTRASQFSVSAFLARVYLYLENWEEAENEADLIINSGRFSLLTDLESVFKANSEESIFELWNQNGFVSNATTLIPTTGMPLYPITNSLMGAFEMEDLRKKHWIGSSIDGLPYPAKYKNRSMNTSIPEYLTVFRLSEQYLIRSEARARKGNMVGAISDLNTIRVRAGLEPLAADLSQEAYLEAIIKERRVEFFSEWGHRYFDLKRMGILDEVMGNYKDTWHKGSIHFPIPQNEITFNSNLIQNQGY